MTDFPGLWSLTPVGALIGVIVLIAIVLIRGAFIPKASHERELALSAKRGDEWKETALAVRAVNAELLNQNSALIESSKITDHFFKVLSHDKSRVENVEQ